MTNLLTLEQERDLLLKVKKGQEAKAMLQNEKLNNEEIISLNNLVSNGLKARDG